MLKIQRSSANLCCRILILSFLVIHSEAFGSVSISLTGSSEKTTNAMERARGNSLSANVSLGLGNHLLIGLTHRREFDNKVGYKKAATNDPNVFAYIPYRDDGDSVTNSLDLTFIPYNGLISPFFFGGVARRDYKNEISFLGNTIKGSQSLFPIPNYGFGTMIQLQMNFQLKITQTYTPGVETYLEDNEEKSRIVKDTYTQVWIGYKL